MNSEANSTGKNDIDTEHEEDVGDEVVSNVDGDEYEPDDTTSYPATDNVGETSVEINVEDLIAEIEAESGVEANPRGSNARKRLDEMLEEKRSSRELEDFEDLEFS